MTVTYGFYNSLAGDRVYDALQVSSLLDGVIYDGIFEFYGDTFEVTPNSGMDINVGIGRAWFNHTWTLNDSNLILTVDQAEVALNRIDTLIIEVNTDNSVRANAIKIIKGTPASSPVHPTLTNAGTLHQYPLYDIYVGLGVTEILLANLTSRIGTDTPYVTFPVLPPNGNSGELTYNAISVTTIDIEVEEGNHYDCTIAGLTADRAINLPTPSAAGKKVSLRILDGDDTYELIIKANSVEITRLFIANETLELMSYGTGAGNWKILRDGRIPCVGEMDRITTNANTTNSAATPTTVDWNHVIYDNGSICDLTNDRFNIRRAGQYEVTFAYRPAGTVTDQKLIALHLLGGASGTTHFGYAINRVAASGAAALANIPSKRVTAAVNDQIIAKFETEEANIGMIRNDVSGYEGSSWVKIKEIL